MVPFLAAAAGCILFIIAAAGTLVPLQDPGGLDYVFAGPPLAIFLFWTAAALAALAVALAGVARCARRMAAAGGDPARTGAWLWPLAALGIVAAGALPAVPGVGVRAAPAGYVLYDLRWWWVAAAVALATMRAMRVCGVRAEDLGTRGRRMWSAATLAAAVIVVALLTCPPVRFSGILHGDEPKYLRYAEVWLQGGVFDISRKEPYAQDRSRRVPAAGAFLRAAARGLAEEARSLSSDVRAWLQAPSAFRWHRVSGADGFVTGKHGGVYQIHNPGVAIVLLPGYLADRFLVRGTPGDSGEFPARLPATNLVMLLTYAGCAAALFLLLRDALGSAALAWIWSAIAVLTLPVAAFPFQLYPELPALLAIVVLTRVTAFGGFDRVRTGACAGALAAALLWLHPRFLLVSMVFAIAGLARPRAPARRAFAIAYAAVLLTVLAFEYRVTGSAWPTARWIAIEGGHTVDLAAIPLNLLGYAVDRTWGLLPHAPILMLAIPGLVLLARGSPRRAVLLAGLALALAVPAAGHTLSAAGGTPGRLVAAVVPLAFWPVAVAVRRTWRSTSLRVVTVLLTILSLDAAVAYNLHHVKSVGQLRAPAAAGWRPNLLFPEIRGDDWTSWQNLMLLALVSGVLAILTVGVLTQARHSRLGESTAARAPLHRQAALQLVVLVLVSTGAAAATGLWTDPDYIPDGPSAHRIAAESLTALDRCVVCSRTRTGATDWTRLHPNGARSVYAEPDVSNRTLTLTVRLGPPSADRAFGRVRVEFGDGAAHDWTGIVGSRVFQHTYARAGRFRVVTLARVGSGELRRHEVEVEIG